MTTLQTPLAAVDALPDADKDSASRIANIYHVHPLVAGPLASWGTLFHRVKAMGFSHVCLASPFEPGSDGSIFLHAGFDRLHPALGFTGAAVDGIRSAATAADSEGLRLMLDIAPAQLAANGPLSQSHPEWFGRADAQDQADPRRLGGRPQVATPSFASSFVTDAVAEWWIEKLHRLVDAGIAGFRCLSLDRTPALFWRRVIDRCPGLLFLAWTPGLPRDAVQPLVGCGFDLTCCSTAWWDGRSEWMLDECAALAAIAPTLASPEPSFRRRLAERLPFDADRTLVYRRSLHIAAAVGSGLFLPMGFEFASARAFDEARADPADLDAARAESAINLSDEIAAAIRSLAALPPARSLRQLAGPEAPLTALLRVETADIRCSREAALVLINPDNHRHVTVPEALSVLPPSAGVPMRPVRPLPAALRPAEVLVVECRITEPIRSLPPVLDRADATASRIGIENVQPVVSGGDFAAKTVFGRDLVVSADIIADGHDILAGALLWRPADASGWQHLAMTKQANDRWEATLRPSRIGLYQFAVSAWWDEWGTFVHDLHSKVDSGQSVLLDIAEGRHIVERAAARSGKALRDRLTPACQPGVTSDMLLSADIAAAMQEADNYPFAVCSTEHAIRVDRPAAEFASWYELFPRSATDDPRTHGTFRSVVKRLPEIRAMGFDVLYFPPINPIGTINRKGRNNALRAEPSDVGSPYAIGSAEGGHDAINPALGSLDDFRLLIREARAHGLEVALDFAVQCAPDHPWLAEHKDWFRWRPDGSMRYAENPPKKYEDIVNPDFYADASFPRLWTALRDVIRFWADQGVRIFRVDNPHTKPLAFWQWMIADIQSTDPDILFLAEAFTRPKLMYRLAKVGFSQSYTYFTWRNTKQEMTEYLTELTAPPVADFFRPNFFVNTPDINPYFLQTSGRAGFLIRAALAATLSGLWGVYSGFEICEHAPLPGREEYLNSEKYEIRARNHDVPGNIVREITALNRIRTANPALQSHLGLRFYTAFNDQVMLYGKPDPLGGSLILVAISLDPYTPQEAQIEVPLWDLGLSDHAAVAVNDLMRERNFVWRGRDQRIRLEPSEIPFHIWRLSRVGAG